MYTNLQTYFFSMYESSGRFKGMIYATRCANMGAALRHLEAVPYHLVLDRIRPSQDWDWRS